MDLGQLFWTNYVTIVRTTGIAGGPDSTNGRLTFKLLYRLY